MTDCTRLLVILLIFVGSAVGCSRKNPVTKIFANPRVTEVTSHICFTAESLRTDDGVPAYTNDAMGNDLSVDSCKKFCKDSGFNGKMVILSPTSCQCNKWLKYDGERDEGQCDSPCPGNGGQKCGGTGYVSAYPN